MTSIAALPPASYGPPLERTQRARAAYADQVYDPVLDPAVNPAVRDTATEQVTVKAAPENNNELSFWDFLDLINPLQHIPVVNTIYRHMTGDTIKTPVQLIGATVLGGPIGFATAMVDSLIEESTGTDIGGHAMAMLNDAPRQPTHAPVVMPGETQVADAREFIPDDPSAASDRARAQVAAAPVAATPPSPRAVPVMPVTRLPEQIAQGAQVPSPQPPKSQPTESEAIVQTAQIAAQANVFPTFKRNGTPTAAEGHPQPAQAVRAEARFMPINRANAMAAAPARRDGVVTTPAELKARGKFAPGPINGGSAAMAPATLAAATAAQKAPATPVSAQEAHAYGRQVAAGNAPAEMPAWFDGAMKNAIDKYQALQNAR
jgi:hypothetical protein